MEYAGLFETSEEITEDFKDGHFASVNAPTITFPYLRSFVTTFTVNAGLDPVILPTINFQALVEQSKKRECNHTFIGSVRNSVSILYYIQNRIESCQRNSTLKKL